MKKYLTLLAYLVSGLAFAGTGQGTIAKVESGPMYGSLVFITVEGTVSDQPACRTSGNYNFVFDANVPGGKNTLALLLLAKANNQKIIASGNAQCTLYSGVEDLRWLRLE